MERQIILITGSSGQIGTALTDQEWPARVTLLTPPRSELDLRSKESIQTYCAARQVDCIINAAAYTAVDGAEDDADSAYLANANGPRWLAQLARLRNIPLLHVSTDYVFDGKLNRPYQEDDRTAPLGVYGESKLAGEIAVRSIAPRHVILRTAWVFSAQGNNFLRTILRLAGDQPHLRVVADQFGCPTGARDVAAALRTIALAQLDQPGAPSGTYHLVNAGSTSWHGLAEAIMAMSAQRNGPHVAVSPIRSDDFPQRALRPGNSQLDCAKITRDFGIIPRPWQDAVAEVLDQLLSPKAGGSA